MRRVGSWRGAVRRRAPHASYLRRSIADAVDITLALAVLEGTRKATGAPSLWEADTREPGSWDARDWAVMLATTAATVAADLLADGRTLGRVAAGIRLERDAAGRLDARRAMIRECAPYVTGPALLRALRVLARGNLPWMIGGRMALALAIVAVELADPERRSLQDRIAGTRLVRAPRPGWR